MEAKVIFSDGQEFKLPDASYDVFEKHIFEVGNSDIEYKNYLLENGMDELDNYNDSIKETSIVFTNEYGRKIVFKCVSDSYTD